MEYFTYVNNIQVKIGKYLTKASTEVTVAHKTIGNQKILVKLAIHLGYSN